MAAQELPNAKPILPTLVLFQTGAAQQVARACPAIRCGRFDEIHLFLAAKDHSRLQFHRLPNAQGGGRKANHHDRDCAKNQQIAM